MGRENCGEDGTDGFEHAVGRGLGGGIDEVVLRNRAEVGVKVEKNNTGVHGDENGTMDKSLGIHDTRHRRRRR